MRKIKIFNDPVAGFIRISGDILPLLIDHPYFQRLRRIRQLGFTHLVYPGANHTRFEHSLGALQLMDETISSLIQKGVEISEEESEAIKIAILLHDIGHGPYSHSLEKSIVGNITHEELSVIFMQRLNDLYEGKLTLAIKMFRDQYKRPFFHQLISSQLDIDRLDYLRRDSFYSGVREGNIGSDRIVNTLNVSNDRLVIEHKGIYTVENFLISRRAMYWQVYLHKTVISAEQLLLKTLTRARKLAMEGQELFCSPDLKYFLYKDVKSSDFIKSNILDKFAKLDDYDILSSIKVWVDNEDKILSLLSRNLVSRELFRTEISDVPFDKERVDQLMKTFEKKYNVGHDEAGYFVFSDSVSNFFYDVKGSAINVLLGNGKIVDISNTLSGFNLSVSTDPIERFFLCYPKSLLFKL